MEKRHFTLVWIGKALTLFEGEFFLLSARSDQGETILFGGSEEDFLKENVDLIRSCQLPVEIECECRPTGINPPDEPLQWYVGPSYSITIFQSKSQSSSILQDERSDLLDVPNGRISQTNDIAGLSVMSRLVLKIIAIIQRFLHGSSETKEVGKAVPNRGAKIPTIDSEAKLEETAQTQISIDKQKVYKANVTEKGKAIWDKTNQGEQSPSQQLSGISSTEGQPPPSPTSPSISRGTREKYLDNPELYDHSVRDFEDDAPG